MMGMEFSPIVAAFPISFGATGMLAGLGLASLPIIIHLLHRRRFKEIDWAAMEWLLEAMRKKARLLQFEQWLLLAVRTLLVIAVVLAMAKPVQTAVMSLGAAAFGDKPVTHTILVFDNSMSMQYSLAGQSRWERAKKLGQKLLEEGSRGDLVSLIALQTPTQVVVRQPSNNLVEVGREIDAIRPHHGAGPVEAALDAVSGMLEQSRATRKRVVFLTDMQRSAWNSATEQAEFSKRLQKLVGPGREFLILDVGAAASSNSAVIAMEQMQPLAVIRQPTMFRATLAHYSDRPREDVLVEFVVNGQVEATQRVLLPAGGEQKAIVFAHTFRDAGDKAVEVRMAEDTLKIDDRRSLAVKVRDVVKVLAIDGQPSGEPFRSETDYLSVALEPDDSGPFRVAVRPESDLLEAKLDEWDVVALCNVASFTAQEVAVLRDYTKRGGSIAFFLGSQVNLDAYNQMLFEEGAGLLPVKLLELVGDPSNPEKAFTLDQLGYKHPLVASFADNTNAGLLTARIQRYVKVQAPKNSDGTVRPIQTALAYQGGDPAIIFSPIERGLAAVVTTSADLDWNRWAISPSYLPIMQTLVRQLAAAKLTRPPGIVGEAAVVPLPKQGFDVPTTMIGPDGAQSALRVEDQGGVSVVTTPSVDIAGVYDLNFGSPINVLQKIAFNPPPVESNLASYSADEFKSLYPGWNVEIRRDWEGETAPSADQLSSESSLHRPFLWLALALAFFETALAWRCGHHA
jgi:Mg-chelatase subunit ChlD